MRRGQLAAWAGSLLAAGSLATVGGEPLAQPEGEAAKKTDASLALTAATRGQTSGLREARGKVQQIDKANRQLVVDRSRHGPLTLQIDKSTTIFIDGRTGSLDEIGAGSEVRASFESRQGANRAQWIEVNRKPRKQPPPLPEAPQSAPAE
jgi:hypothetical protein